MSFLTPARLQDCSRILRGVALVAARAAADSSALKRAGDGDMGNALREAMKSMSQQTKQIAEMLDTASREQTGASMETNMRRTQEIYEGVASAFTERTQAAVQEGQQAAQASFQEPQAVVESLVNEGRRLFEGASQTAQRAAEGGKETLDQAMRQGQETMREVAPEATRAAEQAARDVQYSAASAGREAAEVVTKAAATAAPLPSRGGKSIVLDFSGGSGTATGGSVGMAPDIDSVAAHPQATAASPTASSNNLYVTADKGVLTTDESTVTSTAALAASLPDPRPSPSTLPQHDQCFVGQPASGRPSAAVIQEASEREDLGFDEGPGLGSPVDPTPRQPQPTPSPESATAGASNVLRMRSDDLAASSASASDPFPEQASGSSAAATEAARLAKEERRLSEREAHVEGHEKAQVQAKKEEVRRKLRERRVPSSQIGRVAGFAQLGASLVYGTMADQVSAYFGGKKQEGGNKYLTERNAERLADALCRMRGAALKLGQMISIQDESVLPPQLSAALERVRAGADIMPRSQLHQVLNAELGADWRSKVASFDDEPLAAASIGQVHGAVLHDGRKVVLKIQYPGVARSIESDVDNMLRVISLANVLPKGMYIENAAKVAKKELKLECDYEYEARCQLRFVQLIEDDPDFRDVVHVPMPIPELCSSSVLCSEWVPGVHIDKVAQMEQPIRDAVGTLLLQLTLRELFEWRFMQTDPNWGNFLYDEVGGKLNLIDFGAAREFPTQFVDDYLSMVKACAERDRDGVVDYSTRLGFLTGDESKVMLDAHSNAGFVVGTPFSAEGLYDFASHHSLTKQVSELGAVMLKHRLTPPPEDSYSLHRKLSGAFLACIKLRAKVPCRQLFYDAYKIHKWGHDGVKAAHLPNIGLASSSV